MWIFDPKKLAAVLSLLHARRYHTYPARIDANFQRLESLIPQDQVEWESAENQKELGRALTHFRVLTWKLGWEKIWRNWQGKVQSPKIP